MKPTVFTQNELFKWEDKYYASYAMKSRYTKGRKYPEKEHLYRSIYQRDRDRIIHSAAFRRLEYKTQVFVYHEGDYYRTRLTHTLEVAQIARTISKILRLNEDLTEAIALAHDLGHTPFGHAVENVLNNLMKADGGFNHNLQGLRVVELLEERYPNFKGLNLSWETLEGIIR
ncbi:MAG: dNTP triphosphohydrolase, partial [Candidatus Omnitrophica bacterium]|nr:dNTP triphosphohydrolase [Candidatus Omnitrophota bacterium]